MIYIEHLDPDTYHCITIGLTCTQKLAYNKHYSVSVVQVFLTSEMLSNKLSH